MEELGAREVGVVVAFVAPEWVFVARIDDVQEPADQCEEVERVGLPERHTRVSHEIGLGLVRILEPTGTAGTEPLGPSALRRDPPTLAVPALLRHPRSLSDDRTPRRQRADRQREAVRRLASSPVATSALPDDPFEGVAAGTP